MARRIAARWPGKRPLQNVSAQSISLGRFFSGSLYMNLIACSMPYFFTVVDTLIKNTLLYRIFLSVFIISNRTGFSMDKQTPLS